MSHPFPLTLQLRNLHEKHAAAARDILNGAALAGYLAMLDEDVANLAAMLRAIAIGAHQGP